MSTHLSATALVAAPLDTGPATGAVLTQLPEVLTPDDVVALGRVLGAARLEDGRDLLLDATRLLFLEETPALLLGHHARHLASRGRRAFLVAANSEVTDVLAQTGALRYFTPRPTLDAALRDLTHAQDDRRPATMADLRAQVRTRPLIARAQGILARRYRMPDSAATFATLRTVSQRHNLPLRVLASAVVTTSPSLPAHRPLPAPSLSFLDRPRTDPYNRGSVLRAALDRALQIGQAPRCDVQLLDGGLGLLVLEKHHGFSPAFQSYFEHLDTEAVGETACSAALGSGHSVSIADVETDPLYTQDATRSAILEEGTRTVLSWPVPSLDGGPVGVISLHHLESARDLTAARRGEFDRLVSDLGLWLCWFEQTRVSAALADLARGG